MKFKSKSTGEKITSEAQAPNAERIETILSTSDFFRATSTRRTLVQRILATGRSVAVGGAVGVAVLSRGMKSAHAAGNPVVDFGNAAVGAERIGIAFYSNALGQESPFRRGQRLGQGYAARQCAPHLLRGSPQPGRYASLCAAKSGARFSVQRLRVPCRNIR